MISKPQKYQNLLQWKQFPISSCLITVILRIPEFLGQLLCHMTEYTKMFQEFCVAILQHNKLEIVFCLLARSITSNSSSLDNTSDSDSLDIWNKWEL